MFKKTLVLGLLVACALAQDDLDDAFAEAEDAAQEASDDFGEDGEELADDLEDDASDLVDGEVAAFGVAKEEVEVVVP